MHSIAIKVQEWLADRLSWVQYPNLRKVVRKPNWKPYRGNPFILTDENHTTDKARLSFFGAVVMFFAAIATLLLAVAALAVGCFILYVIVSSLF